MILPPPASFMAACTALVHRKALVRLVSITRSHSSSSSACGGFRMVDAGIVDEDIDAAELTPDARDHRADRVLVGDVGSHGDRRDAAGCKIGHRFFGLRRVASDDG